MTGATYPLQVVAFKPSDVNEDILSNSEAQSFYDIVTSHEQLMTQLGVDAFVKTKGFTWSAEVKASYAYGSESEEFVTKLVARNRVITHSRVLSRFRLSVDARKFLKRHGDIEFYRKYGDSFIAGIDYGGEFFQTGEFETRSKKMRSSLEVSLRASSAFVEGGVDVKKVVKASATSSRLALANTSLGFDSYGSPDGIDKIRPLWSGFKQYAHAHRNEARAIAVVVVPYALLSDFGPQLGTAEARAVLEEVGEWRARMLNEVKAQRYMLRHPDQFIGFDKQKTEAAFTSNMATLGKIDELAVSIVSNPFKSHQIASEQLRPQSLRWDWKWRVVTDPIVVPIDGTWHNAQYRRTDGDNNVASRSNRDTGYFFRSHLEHDSRKVVHHAFFDVKEWKKNFTHFEGEYNLPVFNVDSGYKGFRIVQIVQDYTRTIEMPGYVLIRGVVRGIKPAITGTYWQELTLILDTDDEDCRVPNGEGIGFKGTIRFRVLLEEE